MKKEQSLDISIYSEEHSGIVSEKARREFVEEVMELKNSINNNEVIEVDVSHVLNGPPARNPANPEDVKAMSKELKLSLENVIVPSQFGTTESYKKAAQEAIKGLNLKFIEKEESTNTFKNK